MADHTQGPFLITGALGFVGHHLAHKLLQSGQTVIGLGKQSPEADFPATVGLFTLTGPAQEYPDAVIYKSDVGSMLYFPIALEDATAVKRLLAQFRFQAVYHLAAQSSAALSFREPAQTISSNVLGTLHILEAMRALPAAQCPVLLAVGSCEEYGRHDLTEMPLSEAAPLAPVSPYGVSKASQTLLCQQYVTSYGLPVVIARSFSHTGRGHDRRFAFPSFAAQIAAAEAQKGPKDLLTGDLTAVRDFLDVQDVLQAYRLLVAKGEPGEIYNVSSGRGLTIQQGLDILVAGARCPITVKQDPARSRPSDIPHLVGDNSKLRKRTGWSPQHDFNDTLLSLLDEARKEYQ